LRIVRSACSPADKVIEWSSLVLRCAWPIPSRLLTTARHGLGEIIDFYNKAAADLPAHTILKGMRLPGASVDGYELEDDAVQVDHPMGWEPLIH
jgi:hypothetical protein